MLLNAANGNIKIGNSSMNYVSFGNGRKYLIMIPGLGDGLKTVKGTAIALAIMYRKFAKDYKGIIVDTAEKSYSYRKIKRYRILYPILSRIGKPKDFTRFIIQAFMPNLSINYKTGT